LTSITQGATSLQVLSNFVNGERVAAADGRASDVADPSTGEAYARAPVSGEADVAAAMTAAARATRRSWPAATGWGSAATASLRPSSPGCGKTTR
jgi:hypothetical protein